MKIETTIRGINIFNDIINFLPNYYVQNIFDVGANIGQSVKVYADLFPFSNIFCFEPVYEAFSLLKQNTEENSKIHCFQAALSSFNGGWGFAFRWNINNESFIR